MKLVTVLLSVCLFTLFSCDEDTEQAKKTTIEWEVGKDFLEVSQVFSSSDNEVATLTIEQESYCGTDAIDIEVFSGVDMIYSKSITSWPSTVDIVLPPNQNLTIKTSVGEFIPSSHLCVWLGRAKLTFKF